MIRTRGLVFALIALLAAIGGGCSIGASGREQPTLTIMPGSGDRLEFQPAVSSVGSPGAVRIVFRNESTLPHNLVFVEGVTASTDTIVQPGTTDEITVALPAAGTYRFVCTIHEGMAGSITVAASGGGAAAAAGVVAPR